MYLESQVYEIHVLVTVWLPIIFSREGIENILTSTSDVLYLHDRLIERPLLFNIFDVEFT